MTEPTHLRLVRGTPTPEDLAALVAVLSASAGPAADADLAETHWAAPARLLRASVEPKGWWASALPR